MVERDFEDEFFALIGENFSEAENVHLAKIVRSPAPTEQDEQVEQDLAERIYHASKDPRIFDYISTGEGRGVLINQLQLDYDLTEEQASDIVADVEYGAGEVVDYDDET